MGDHDDDQGSRSQHVPEPNARVLLLAQRPWCWPSTGAGVPGQRDDIRSGCARKTHRARLDHWYLLDIDIPSQTNLRKTPVITFGGISSFRILIMEWYGVFNKKHLYVICKWRYWPSKDQTNSEEDYKNKRFVQLVFGQYSRKRMMSTQGLLGNHFQEPTWWHGRLRPKILGESSGPCSPLPKQCPLPALCDLPAAYRCGQRF